MALMLGVVLCPVPWVMVPLSERYAIGTSSLGGVKDKSFPLSVPWSTSWAFPESVLAKIATSPNWVTLPCPPVIEYDVEPIVIAPLMFCSMSHLFASL